MDTLSLNTKFDTILEMPHLVGKIALPNQSLLHEGHWGTTDNFTTSLSILFVLHCPLGLGKLQACPFLNADFPLLFLSALSSFSFHCALHDVFGQT